MPNSEDVQPPLPDSTEAPAELLDQSSLNTVLDIVDAIETAEELTLLETLTPAQKRQVWSAISDEQKQRLKKIRMGDAAAFNQAIGGQDAAPQQPADEPESSLDLEADELETDDLETELQEALEEITQARLDHLRAEQPEVTDQPSLEVGDRVVLLPKPQLSSAELIAIWDVVDLQNDTAQIETKRLGTRHYPLSWMVIYPEPDF
jgi:hypothetical protein